MAAPLRVVVNALRARYGKAEAPPSTDPFALVVFENMAYLAPDEKRRAAFAALRRDVGVSPREILKASIQALTRACRIGGIYPEKRADRLRRSAEIAISAFDGDLRDAVRLPQPEARKALRRFPAIGEPGADKILLFCGGHPTLAPGSNALRVLARLGIVPEERSYAATYRAALAAADRDKLVGRSSLLEAHQLLRRHGQELCRRAKPACDECPLRSGCDYFARMS